MAVTSIHTQAARMTMHNALHTFLEYSLNHHSPCTYRNYQRCLWEFADSLPPKILLVSVTSEHIENFINSLSVKKSTKNSCLIPIKSFFHWAADSHHVPNPTTNIKFFKVVHNRRYLTEDEFQKVLAVCETGTQKALMQVLATTGLRISELFFVLSNPASIHDSTITVCGKGQKERSVPLCQTAHRSLTYLMNLSKSLRIGTPDYLCRKLAKRAHIEPFSCHSLRRLFANRLRRNNVDMLCISKVLGHSSLLVTQIYFDCEAELAHLTDFMDNPPPEPCED